MVTLETVKERRRCLFVDGVEAVDSPQDMLLEPEGHGGLSGRDCPESGSRVEWTVLGLFWEENPAGSASRLLVLGTHTSRIPI